MRKPPLPPGFKKPGPQNTWRSNRSPIEKTSEQINQDACHSSPGCGSCVELAKNPSEILQNKYDSAIKALQTKINFKSTKLIAPVAAPFQTSYRCHAKLAVRSKPKSMDSDRERFVFGIFENGTHRVRSTLDCRLHRESANAVIRDIKNEVEKSDIQPYDEESHTGDLRYLVVRASHLTKEVMITFVMKDLSHKKTLQSIARSLSKLDHRVASMYLNVQADRGNVIFGSENHLVSGQAMMRESFCGIDFWVGPTTFFQINPWQAEHIYRRIEQIIGPTNESANLSVWDLYGGIGVIGNVLSKIGYRSLTIEENTESVQLAKKNYVANKLRGDAVAGRVEDLLTLDSTHLPDWARRPSFLVANPSRRGMDVYALESISQVMKQQSCSFIYMSCDSDSLGRDLSVLIAKGFRLRQLEAFDMFPYTQKLEWLALVSL